MKCAKKSIGNRGNSSVVRLAGSARDVVEGPLGQAALKAVTSKDRLMSIGRDWRFTCIRDTAGTGRLSDLMKSIPVLTGSQGDGLRCGWGRVNTRETRAGDLVRRDCRRKDLQSR